jgi:hypothetical protein
MQEDEARTKWCPYARTSQADSSGNRRHGGHGDPDPDCKCIASRCMAWRWSYDMEEGLSGYCGLAGREGAP